ncbi:thiopurine S-methyltransferase [Spongorhabdus nitratireducens]
MEASFWHSKWESQQIGFHLSDVNPFLVRYWEKLGLDGGTVLVPLCGKSLDMAWLHQNNHFVIGNELSKTALEAFISEQQLQVVHSNHNTLDCYSNDSYQLWQGDFFNLTTSKLPKLNAFYDRAALIALPPEIRQHYWTHLASMLEPGTPGLLITLDYPQQQLSGPPFCVTEDEVKQLSEGLFEVELLCREDVLAENPRFVKKQVERLDELVFRLIRL